MSRTEAREGDGDERSKRRWLLLTHQLPSEPAYLRVKVRRRLERIGAIALKNSVYALPAGDDPQEDFAWLCQEIERSGGTTSLCLARFLDESTDERLITGCREARSADYQAIADEVRRLATDWEDRNVDPNEKAAGRTRLNKARERLAAVIEIDFFRAPGREHALREIERADTVLRAGPTVPTEGTGEHERGPVGRTWVTRVGVKVDRIASAWLIRRFVDPAATFKFVSARGYEPAGGELRFDMFEGEFTHVGEACTFETLLDRFGLTDDGALVTIGEIVHDIDCKDGKFGRAEVGGVASVILGIASRESEDDRRIAMGGTVLDALYESFGGERA